MSALAEMKAGKRGTVMGLYSVILGVGQLLGAMVGGFLVDLGGFTGLLSLGCVVYMRMHRDDLIEILTMKAASG
jgi:MFS family permease